MRIYRTLVCRRNRSIHTPGISAWLHGCLVGDELSEENRSLPEWLARQRRAQTASIRGVNASSLNGQTLSNLTGARHADVKKKAFYNRCVGVKYVSSQLLRGVARAGER